MSQCGSKCGPSCPSGGCHDFSSRAERLPGLLSLDVSAGIFTGAVRNMTMRVSQQKTGMMSDEEFEAAKDKLVNWLVITYSGENPHYEADDEWHRYGGLTDYLSDMLQLQGHSARQVLTLAACRFADEAEGLARQLVLHGGLTDAVGQAAVEEFGANWAHLFTGAPAEYL